MTKESSRAAVIEFAVPLVGQRRRPRYVFVAGPYTGGDVAENVRAAIQAAESLRRAGFIPFLPHLTHFWHLVTPAPYQAWIDYDAAWLERCDALVRLPGDSPGADGEVALARRRGIPVFEGVGKFLAEWNDHA